MAQNHSKESSPILYTIIIAAAMMTLLFVYVNHNTKSPKAQLAGDVSHVTVVVKDTTAQADTTHVAADTSHAEPAAH
jgi:hypothetical protein